MKQTSNCFLLILLMMIIIVNDKSCNAIKSTPVKNAIGNNSKQLYIMVPLECVDVFACMPVLLRC